MIDAPPARAMGVNSQGVPLGVVEVTALEQPPSDPAAALGWPC